MAAAIGPNPRALPLERGVGSLEIKGVCRTSTQPSVSLASTRIARMRTCTRAACLWPCALSCRGVCVAGWHALPPIKEAQVVAN
jgi:hypothetical protein